MMYIEPNDTGLPTPLSAEIVNGKLPPVVGVPVIAPVLTSKLTPLGSEPVVTEYEGAGYPAADT